MTNPSNGFGCTNAGRISRLSASSIEKRPGAHHSKQGARGFGSWSRGLAGRFVSNPCRSAACKVHRPVGDRPVGGNQQPGDRRGVLQFYPHDLGRINDPTATMSS